MKKLNLLVILSIFLITSCSKSDDDNDDYCGCIKTTYITNYDYIDGKVIVDDVVQSTEAIECTDEVNIVSIEGTKKWYKITCD